ncbi:MAG: hypothetical protein ACM3RP_00755 [Chitinophagales bacterium]
MRLLAEMINLSDPISLARPRRAGIWNAVPFYHPLGLSYVASGRATPHEPPVTASLYHLLPPGSRSAAPVDDESRAQIVRIAEGWTKFATQGNERFDRQVYTDAFLDAYLASYFSRRPGPPGTGRRQDG